MQKWKQIRPSLPVDVDFSEKADFFFGAYYIEKKKTNHKTTSSLLSSLR